MYDLVITRYLNSNSSIVPLSEWSESEKEVSKSFNGQLNYYLSIKNYTTSYTSNDSVTMLTYSNIETIDDAKSLNNFRDPNTNQTDVKTSYYNLLRSKNISNYNRVTKEIFQNGNMIELLEDKTF
jgi:hypothetical protein